MKRFLIDALLIFVLVAIGSSVFETENQVLEDDIILFEEQVENEWIIEQGIDGTEVADLDNGNAAMLAQKSSEIIHDSVEAVVKTVASLFSILLD